MSLKYGKLPPKTHPKTLLLSKYLKTGELAPPPEKRAWEYVIPDDGWGMLGNDTVGDCVIAAMMHYVMAATANAKKPATFTTQNALDTYSAITGYNPADPSTDQGTAWTDALAYWQAKGVTDADGNVHKILGWASIAFADLVSLRQGINLFGGILIGTQVPQSAEDQFNAGQPWNVLSPPDTNIVGGHGIPGFGYGSEGETVVTWGKREPMDLVFPGQYFDEAYVVITQDFMDAATSETPSGIDLTSLQADLAALQST